MHMIPGIGINIALYFFLAGAGAGAYILSVLLDAPSLRMDATNNTAEGLRINVTLASLCLVVLGSVFLLADLGVPSLAHFVLVALGSSVISFGAWAILAFVIFAALRLIAEKTVFPFHQTAARVCTWLAFLAAWCVAGYTGWYLYSTHAVLFWHTLSVVALFVASALSTGAGVLMLLSFLGTAGCQPLLPRIAHIDGWLIAAEALLLAWFGAGRLLAGGRAAALAMELFTGGHALMFWGATVILGLIVPFAAERLALLPQNRICYMVAALGVLAGGLALRCSIILV